jgi:serine/threonine protein kinase
MEGTPFGRYRLIELLGRGGMGEVWKAFDTATNRVVAVKVLPANLANDPQFEQRFRREAFAAAGLANPHVVPIHTFGEIDGRLYVDMRLIEGRDLQSILAHGPLEPARAVGIIDQVASALHAAHRIGLVHRDVKPSNILVDEDDFAYLIDFGIARAAGETGLTATGSVIGTWAYLAPERLTSGQTDPRADIYALTCVLHECLTGNQPFPGNSVEQLITAHLTLPPPRPSVLQDTVPAAMDAVIAKGMAKNPDERYPTAKELAKVARAAITQPIATPPPTTQAPQRTDPAPGRPHESLAPPDNRPTPRGVSPSAPTQWRPNLETQRPDQKPPAQAPRGKGMLWGGIAAGVGAGVGVIAVVTVVLVMTNGDTGAGSDSATSSATSSATPSTTASSRESERQRSLTTQAIHRSCEALSSSSVDATTAVNNYVDSFNRNAADVAAKTGPAIDSLNHSADLVSGSLSDALPLQLRDALTGWVDAARALATAIAGNHGPDQFNAAITRLNDTKTKALDLCDKSY